MNKFVKRTIAGAIVGGTLVSCGIATSNLINDGKFELIRDRNSLIKHHQYIKTEITPEEKNHEIEYISRYDRKANIERDSSFVFRKPCGLEKQGIKVETDTYFINDISDHEVVSLLKNVDLNNSDDLKAIKNILTKMNAYKSETSYNFISEYAYQKDYISKNVSNNISYYSYNQNYDKTILQPMDVRSLEIYNKDVNFKILLGSLAGAFAFGGYYTLKKNNNKIKRKVRYNDSK